MSVRFQWEMESFSVERSGKVGNLQKIRRVYFDIQYQWEALSISILRNE